MMKWRAAYVNWERMLQPSSLHRPNPKKNDGYVKDRPTAGLEPSRGIHYWAASETGRDCIGSTRHGNGTLQPKPVPRPGAVDARTRHAAVGNGRTGTGEVKPLEPEGATSWAWFQCHFTALADDNGWTSREAANLLAML
jgi:hypothetical protein